MRIRVLVPLVLGLAASWNSSLAAQSFPEAYPPTNEIRVDNRVAIPMRDGVVLFADVYRPVEDGQYPVIVSRTPYSTERAGAYESAEFYARRGYVYVFQDVRGRHESEGRWEPFRDDLNDGYDTVEWAATQPWSNGKVGMQGGSYLGQNQWRAAQAKPPHLVTIVPRVASTSIYHDWITVNGGWRLAFNFGWGAVRQESRIMQNPAIHSAPGGPPSLNYDQILHALPLNAMQDLAGRNAQFYRDWLAHPDYDDYWKQLSVEERFSEIGIPVFTIGGWFDIFAQGTLRGYMGVRQKGATPTARQGTHMVIGPWEHGPRRENGDMDWGPDSTPDLDALELRWFDHWLKGEDTELDEEPPAKVFLMGRNEWLFAEDYPLPGTKYLPYYLDSEGAANGSHGNGALVWEKPSDGPPSDSYSYDPANPVPSLGGANCCGATTESGPQDQRPNEGRGDILVYTSEILDEPLTVVGPVRAKLFVSSTAVDTDFVARLIDVHPDGRSIVLAEGVLPARYRNGQDKPELMTPGEVYELEIDLIGTANEFQPGHRVRLHVTSSHFPQFARNLNTGEPLGVSDAMEVAEQTVHHSSIHASHLLLPVVE